MGELSENGEKPGEGNPVEVGEAEDEGFQRIFDRISWRSDSMGGVNREDYRGKKKEL